MTIRACDWTSEEDAILLANARKPHVTLALELSRRFARLVTVDALEKRLRRLRDRAAIVEAPASLVAPAAPRELPDLDYDEDPAEPAFRDTATDIPAAAPAAPPVRCSEHPDYQAVREPMRTTRHPDGCAACWDVYRSRHGTPQDTERPPQAVDARPDPLEERAKRDEVSRLKAQVDDLVRRLKEANERQAFIDAAARFRSPPRILRREKTSGIREITPIVLASDWHVEEPVEPESISYVNEYNLAIAEERIERFFRHIIWHIEHHRASGRLLLRDLILWLGGDLYSGYIHEELVESNLLAPVEAVHWLLPKIRDGILTLLEVLGLERLVIPCSHGNHGRTTKKPTISTGYANSFDFLLYHWLQSEFRNDPRVEFVITASAHQYVEVYDRTIHFHHGDDIKYQGGVGGLGIPLLKRVPLWDRVRPSYLHCIGHWHQVKDYGRAIINGSLIGFNAYAQRIGADLEPPQQALFYIDAEDGKTMLTPVRVDRAMHATEAAA